MLTTGRVLTWPVCTYREFSICFTQEPWRRSVCIATRYGLDDRRSNSGGGDISRTHPDRPWDPLSLLYNGYWVSTPGVKRPGRGVDHPPVSSAEVKERLELCLYSPSGPSWPLLGRTQRQNISHIIERPMTLLYDLSVWLYV